MKFKKILSLLIITNLMGCVGGNLIQQSQSLNSNTSVKALQKSSAMLSSGVFDDIQNDNNMWNLIVEQNQRAKGNNDTLISIIFQCDKSDYHFIDMDLSLKNLANNNVVDWASLVRYLNYKVANYNPNYFYGGVSLNIDKNKIIFMIYSISTNLNENCYIKDFPDEKYPMNSVLKLTQKQGATN